MGVLTAVEILGKEDLPRELIEIPEWGGAVYVRTFSGAERDSYEEWILKNRGSDGELKSYRNARALLVVLTACDENGALLFTADQVDALGKKSAAALDRIFEVAQRLNKLRKQDIEDSEKN